MRKLKILLGGMHEAIAAKEIPVGFHDQPRLGKTEIDSSHKYSPI